MSAPAEWFLTSRERGNPDWDRPAWTEVEQLSPGDHLFFVDWRGDAGRLRPHEIEHVDPLTRLWAEPAYLMIFDPHGRSYADRLLGRGP